MQSIAPKKNHISLGKEGEELACEYLQKKGYEIVTRNYRFDKIEIDIVAKKENLLVFAEVKTRKSGIFEFPEEAVNNTKIYRIERAAIHFTKNYEWKGEIRFDVVAIIKKSNENFEIKHLIQAN